VLGSAVDEAAATLVRDDVLAAALSMRISGTDLLRLALGQLDPIEGVMGGRISLTGDLEQVMRLGSIFAAGPALAVG
jgi:putative sterol carrier protein